MPVHVARPIALALFALLFAATPARSQQQATAAPVDSSHTAPVVPLSAAQRTKYVGDYDVSLPDGQIMGIRIYVRGDELVAEPEQQEGAVLRYYGDDTFGIDEDPTIRLHWDVKDGKITGGTLMQRGMKMNVFTRP